jgi:hypothetical protein
MRLLAALLPLGGLLGCTDYFLRHDGDHQDTDGEDYADTATWGTDCPDKVYDAYEADLSPGCNPGGGDAMPDLTVAPAARCEVDCDVGSVVLWVHPGNRGAAEPDGARLDVYTVEDGERSLLQSRPVETSLPAGWYADSMQFDLRGLEWDDIDALVFRIATDVEDCQPDNDELNFVGPFCEG